MKTCKTCNKELDLDRFYSNGYTPKGTKKFKPNCKSCDKLLTYDRYFNLLLECLDEQGRKLECEKCGYNDHKAALQFHHNTKEKNFSISNSKSRKKETIYYELSICDVLCANCHAVHHFEESRS